MWTRFMDMHSGGEPKEPQQYIYIEAPIEEAKVIFYNRFGHNPDRVTCTCCGDDYSIGESETLAEASGYDRGCRYDKMQKGYVDEPDTERWARKYVTVEEYAKRKDVLIIPASNIKDGERVGQVPEQGYIWKD